MYNEILEEYFGTELVAEKFGESDIDTLGFRIAGPTGGWNFIPPAQFREYDTIGYARAMLNAVDNFVTVLSREYKEEISIKLERAEGRPDDHSTALVFINTKSNPMQERLHCMVYGAAEGIRRYGDRLRNSF